MNKLIESEEIESESERERRDHEGWEKIDPRNHHMDAAATTKGEGFYRRRVQHGGSRPSPHHRSRPRQSFRRRRGCSFYWNLCSHLQAHQRKNLCRSLIPSFNFL